MLKIKHVVVYNYLFSHMEKQFTTGLKLYNSLSNNLQQFIPMRANNVRWYTCGPTVYSNSHMGHARNYLCNDMVRRVLRDHFGYNVQYCMNITDVDDKIIKNSNQQGIEYFQFARKWEADFFRDMNDLGVEDPDYLTRVTEYIPEIVKFIQKIVANGYAYMSNGSVYFDIESFKAKFKYGKLKRVKQAETQEQETNELGQKRNKQDFALWKAAKPNQPKWQSPWGQGRPGWHIQCSAMAASILGQKMDIHSGGIDLIFPHHQNQLAQSEAYNNEAQWVNYFLHVGHLHIKGLKMSKSLKNFITIKQLTKTVSPRVIKLYFFLHRYDVVLNYDPETSLKQATQKDTRYKNFFNTLKTAIRDQKISNPQKMSQEDRQFDAFLEQIQQKIHEGFCNNIDTPSVIKEVDEAIKKVNVYLASKTLKVTLLKKAYRIIIHPFKVMGVVYEQNEQKGNSIEESLLTSITKYRDQIRENSKSDFKTILQICDKFRDFDLVELGVRLQDKKIGQPSTWKYQKKQILVKEREVKEQAKRNKQKQNFQKQQEKLKKMSVNPRDMFKNDPTYTQFDENGVPTHQKKKQKGKQEEVAINDKLKNKLLGQWNAQNELYLKYLEIKKQQNKQ